MKGFVTLPTLIAAALVLGAGVWFSSQEPTQEVVGQFQDTLLSIDLADNPVNGYVLSTDGTDNSWIVNTGGSGGGSGIWFYTAGTDVISPIVASSSNSARITASSFHATSTATSSTFNDIDFTNASGTGITATNFWGSLIGNSDTATALSANGSNCSAGNAPLGVDASGAVEGCFDVWTEAENTSAAYLSTVDISDDTNLAGDAEIVLTNDTLSIASTLARDSELHDAVTLSGTPDYITLSGQVITRGTIDISDDTNLAAGTNITLTGDTLNVDDAFLVNNANDSTSGRLTVAGLTSSASILASSTLQITANASNQVARFFENSGGEYMDMQVDANGDLSFVADDGGTRFSIFDATDAIAMGDSLQHIGDSDTFMQFDTDQMNFTAGNLTFLNLVESTSDTATALGEWDFGGATSIELVNGTAPTVNAEGEIAVDTTSGQLKYYGNSAERVISEVKEKSFIVASSTLDYYGSFGASGTTTLLMWNPDKAVTVDRIYCKARTAGTISIRFGDGTNYSETKTCTTSGVEDSSLSNNTFTANEDFEIQFGSQTSSSDGVTVTVTYSETAD